MNLLIDTHYLLWVALEPSFLKPWEEAHLSSVKNTVFVSSATVYEIALKVRIGKLPGAEAFERDILQNIPHLGYTLLDLTPEVMLRAARFPARHGDPFDRIIAAQAIHLDLPLLTVDPKLDAFNPRRLHPPTTP